MSSVSLLDVAAGLMLVVCALRWDTAGSSDHRTNKLKTLWWPAAGRQWGHWKRSVVWQEMARCGCSNRQDVSTVGFICSRFCNLFFFFSPSHQVKIEGGAIKSERKGESLVWAAQKMKSWVLTKTETELTFFVFVCVSWIKMPSQRSKCQKSQKRNALHDEAEGKDHCNIRLGFKMKDLRSAKDKKTNTKKHKKYSNRDQHSASAVWVVEIITLHGATGSV